MKNAPLFLLLALLWGVPAVAADEWVSEVEHLLGFIEQSNCLFVRNGKTYPADQARQHIGKKYTYLKKRLRSAEQFILHAASKSSITGTPYTVICDGETLPSRQWLEVELERFRRSAAGAR